MPPGANDTHKSLRSLSGTVCPQCRHHLPEPAGARLARCPAHPGTVLVSPAALAAADGDPFLGRVVGDRFAILELVGAGSMGTVYRARQEAIGRDVAIKIVRADRLVDKHGKTRFQQEAHATSRLSSVHTVTVFDFGEIEAPPDDPAGIGGSLFLAMELLEGDSIGELLKRGKGMPLADALLVLRHALVSLEEAHEKGVIHRDLKPDNLLLTSTQGGDRVCKVLDFGIAKLVTTDGRVDALETQAGTVFGTPRYMSPEQAQGKKLDARSDLYALGVILYHMLVGSPPFTDGDAVVVMAHHIRTVPKRPSALVPEVRIPAGLEDLLMRVLDKDPEKRPQSARAFLAELAKLPSDGDGAGSGELSAVIAGGLGSRGKRRVALGLGVAALAGGIAFMLGAAREGGAERDRRTEAPGARISAARVSDGEAVQAVAAASASSSASAASSSLANAPRPEPSASAAPDGAAAPAASGTSRAPGVKPRRGYTKFD